MDVERQIQAAVARADLIVCAALRALAITILMALLLGTVLFARKMLGYDVHWIDYDAPGVDVTSDGPENWEE